MFNINVCQWLDLNCGPLDLEATALPTDPQPLPRNTNLCHGQNFWRSRSNGGSKINMERQFPTEWEKNWFFVRQNERSYSLANPSVLFVHFCKTLNNLSRQQLWHNCWQNRGPLKTPEDLSSNWAISNFYSCHSINVYNRGINRILVI